MSHDPRVFGDDSISGHRAAFKTPRHIPPDHFFFAASSAKRLTRVLLPFQEYRSHAERDAVNGVS